MLEERFRIELWHANGHEQVLAKAVNDKHAREVYAVMASRFLGQTVVLWDRARIIERSDDDGLGR